MSRVFLLVLIALCFNIKSYADITIVNFPIEGQLLDVNEQPIPSEKLLIVQGGFSTLVITDTKGNFKSNLTFAIPCISGRNVSYLDEAIVKQAMGFNGKEIIFYFTQRRIAFVGQEIWMKRYKEIIPRKSKEVINLKLLDVETNEKLRSYGYIFYEKESGQLITNGSDKEKLERKLKLLDGFADQIKITFNQLIDQISFISKVSENKWLGPQQKLLRIDGLKMKLSYYLDDLGYVENFMWKIY